MTTKKKIDEEALIAEYLAGGVGYQQLGKKYGCSASTAHKYIMRYQRRISKPRNEIADPLPAEFKKLQKEVELERLRTKLLNAMIDIAEEDLGVEIRKKAGTKRS